jgi:hypothetical protein
MCCSSAGMFRPKTYTNYINRQNTDSIYVTKRDEPIQEEMNVKFLGLETDNDMNWKTQIECILLKLKSACYVVTSFKHYSTIETLKMVYHAYFHSAVVYSIIFWGNSLYSNKVFLQQKRIVRTRIKPQSTYKSHFKILEILAMPSQFILSLTEFLANNFTYFFLIVNFIIN